MHVVADGLSVGQLTLSGIGANGQVTLNGLSANSDLQQTGESASRRLSCY